MPEISQYTFSLTEIMEVLVKEADLHEGMWQLLISFNFGAGNFPVDAKTHLPGAVATIASIGLSRAEANSPPNLVVDAAKVNPVGKRPTK